MTSAILQLIICFWFFPLGFALPYNTRRRSLATGDTSNISTKNSLTLAIPPRTVTCLSSRVHPRLVSTDCAFVLNEILLKEGSVFEALVFSNESYQTAAGVEAPSQWRYGQCQVSVNGRLGARENLTLFDIALTANRILSICDLEVSPARGGMSLIGDVMNGFFVNVEGYAPKRYGGAVNVTSIDSQPVTASSKRGPESQQDWESL